MVRTPSVNSSKDCQMSPSECGLAVTHLITCVESVAKPAVFFLQYCMGV